MMMGLHGLCYKIPPHLFTKYHGCGNGQIVINKHSNELLDMDYLDENDMVIDDNNIEMREDAGEVLNQTKLTITYRANFSCYDACLF